MTDKLLEMFKSFKDSELGNRIPGQPNNVTYEFKGDPDSTKLAKIASEISKDIINAFQGCAIATTKSIYGTIDRQRPYKVELKYDENGSLMNLTRDEVTLKILGTCTTDLDDTSYPFNLADILDNPGEVTLCVANPDGSFRKKDGKLIRASTRVDYARRLVDTYRSLAAKYETEVAGPRREREAQEAEIHRVRHARNMTPEERFAALATIRVPYEGDSEFKYSLFYLATHANTISASVKEEYLPTFESIFHVDARNTPSISIIPKGKVNSTGTPAKYSCSLRISLKKAKTPIPNYLLQFATGNAITDTNFISQLILDYDFEFGKVDSQKMIQILIDRFGTDDVPEEYLEQPVTTDTNTDPVDPGEDVNPFDIDFPPAE
jgi:hypothetical protein